MSMQKHRRVPIRTCVVCGIKGDKRSLIRLVRTETGLQADPTGKMNGRGAYLCHNATCWQKALDGQHLNRALRVPLTEADYHNLRQMMPQFTS